MGAEFSEIIWIIAGCAALLALFVVCRRIGGRRNTARSRAAQAETYLLAAVASASVFDVSFAAEEGGETTRLNAVCKGMEKDRLHMETDSTAVEPVLGGQVEASFALTQGMYVGLYRFRSEVLGFFPEESGYSFELASPADVTRVQRRAFMRHTPAASAVRECRAWELSDRAIAEHQPVSLSVTRYTRADTTLLNLSAGGLKLLLDAEKLSREGRLETREGEPWRHLLLFLDLRGQAECKDLAVWLVGKVTHVESSDRGMGVGLQFLRWRLSTGGGEKLPWQPASEAEGVEPLMRWVMQADLARRREEAEMSLFGEAGSAERLALFLRDSLTGVATESYFLAHLEGALEGCRQQRQALGCIVFEVLDLDGIRTTCGENVAEHVLKTAAMLIGKSVRATDMVGRIGENRFYIALQETDLPGARILAGRLRRKVEDTVFPLDSGGVLRLVTRTGCVAVSRGSADIPDAKALIEAANASLAQALRL